MRREVLLRSVQKRLPDGESVAQAAFMWQRHRWMPGFAVLAFVALFFVAAVSGFTATSARVGLGLAGAAIAGSAATRYFVVARTSQGMVLLRASRIRQYATELLERLPSDTTIERVGGTMLANDWEVDGVRYTVARTSELAIADMASGVRST